MIALTLATLGFAADPTPDDFNRLFGADPAAITPLEAPQAAPVEPTLPWWIALAPIAGAAAWTVQRTRARREAGEAGFGLRVLHRSRVGSGAGLVVVEVEDVDGGRVRLLLSDTATPTLVAELGRVGARDEEAEGLVDDAPLSLEELPASAVSQLPERRVAELAPRPERVEPRLVPPVEPMPEPARRPMVVVSAPPAPPRATASSPFRVDTEEGSFADRLSRARALMEEVVTERARPADIVPISASRGSALRRYRDEA